MTKILPILLVLILISWTRGEPKAKSQPYGYQYASLSPNAYPHASSSSYGAPQPNIYAQPQYGGYPKGRDIHPGQQSVISPPQQLKQPQALPQQNCTVEDVVLTAEICIPDCKQTEVTSDIEVCSVDYENNEKTGKAKTVEVVFNKECETRLVTVCQDVQQATNGGTEQQCSEVEQETCFNIPTVQEVEIEVNMAFPKPSRDCDIQTVTIPEITCEDIVEQKCQNIPRIVETPSSFDNCQVVVGEPKCEEIELVLPKQVCTDILYGFAEVPVEAPEPQFEQQPQPSYIQYNQAQYGSPPNLPYSRARPNHYG
eukprot:TCALIF_09771-PA protein Name:"Protein of unknown function" AED:0.45 eAED:0.45 QI:24/1/0.66/1/0.5/0.33/3/0/311